VKTRIRHAFARSAAALLAAAGLAATAGMLLALEVPPLAGRVNDLAGMLDAEARARLEQKLGDFESEAGSQIAVLTLPSLEGESIEDFSIRVADAWQLGRAGADDGVLLLLARDERQLRLEVGYGLEGRVPDALARRIVDNVIVPRLQEGNVAAGVEEGVDAVIELIRGGDAPPEVTAEPAVSPVVSVLLALWGAASGCLTPIGIIALFIVFSILERKYPRLFAKISSSGGSGWSSRSGGYSSSSSSRSSGGSSRSFSGGGGRFGGGGASGRW
jgi:uncharacterized protein